MFVSIRYRLVTAGNNRSISRDSAKATPGESTDAISAALWRILLEDRMAASFGVKRVTECCVLDGYRRLAGRGPIAVSVKRPVPESSLLSVEASERMGFKKGLEGVAAAVESPCRCRTALATTGSVRDDRRRAPGGLLIQREIEERQRRERYYYKNRAPAVSRTPREQPARVC